MNREYKKIVLFKTMIWKWFWGDEVFEDTPFDRNDKEQSVSSNESVHEEDDQEETTHAVVFKCVGVNKGESKHKIKC